MDENAPEPWHLRLQAKAKNFQFKLKAVTTAATSFQNLSIKQFSLLLNLFSFQLQIDCDPESSLLKRKKRSTMKSKLLRLFQKLRSRRADRNVRSMNDIKTSETLFQDNESKWKSLNRHSHKSRYRRHEKDSVFSSYDKVPNESKSEVLNRHSRKSRYRRDEKGHSQVTSESERKILIRHSQKSRYRMEESPSKAPSDDKFDQKSRLMESNEVLLQHKYKPPSRLMAMARQPWVAILVVILVSVFTFSFDEVKQLLTYASDQAYYSDVIERVWNYALGLEN